MIYKVAESLKSEDFFFLIHPLFRLGRLAFIRTETFVDLSSKARICLIPVQF